MARSVSGFQKVQDLCKLMVYGSLKREEAQHLAALSKLQILELHQVNDDCIDYLEDLSELRDFVVGGSGLTDDGFAKVPEDPAAPRRAIDQKLARHRCWAKAFPNIATSPASCRGHAHHRRRRRRTTSRAAEMPY